MKINHCTFYICLFWVPFLAQCQATGTGNDTCRIVFYNTENLYDPFDDSLIRDEDYLPGEARAWSYGKLRTKLVHVSRALIASGGWQKPALIGLCEVENRWVVEQLVRTTPLQAGHYQIIHYESPDTRGIDVCLLYDSSQFRPLVWRPIGIHIPADEGFRTRDILYVCGLLHHKDSLHVFVNHWPSKYGGIASSLVKRKFTAGVLRHLTDSLLDEQPGSRIIIMGDFNDGPEEEVMQVDLGATTLSSTGSAQRLFNIMGRASARPGTHKYQGEWSILDQFIVSPALLKGRWCVDSQSPVVISEAFLLEEDPGFTGRKPFRTYSGPRYTGGYSDHLPIRMDIVLQP